MKAFMLVFILCSLQLGLANDPPRVTLTPRVKVVNENVPAGTPLFSFSATDSDGDDVTYSLASGIISTMINITTADVLLNGKLDFETTNRYSIIFSATDGTNVLKLAPVILIVADVNDNAPVFQRVPYTTSVLENATTGDEVFTGVTATDVDQNDRTTFTMQGGSDTFLIDPDSGVVTLNKPLNYQQNRLYQVEITATDRVSHNRTTNLLINVQDVQNLPPEFLRLPYRKEIRENATVGTTVLTVSARDQDYGVPNEIKYMFVDGFYENFIINEVSGEITVGKQVDRDNQTVIDNGGIFTMTVQAKENTTNPQGVTTANTTVTILIQDVNDVTPEFNQKVYNATVQENAVNGIAITLDPPGLQMIVQDKDQGDNAYFQLSIEGDANDVFEVVPSAERFFQVFAYIKVKNSTVLDFEKVHSLEFVVVAKETRTSQKLSSRARVVVNIENMNDDFPHFNQSEYVLNINENAPNNTPIHTFTATDSDDGAFGKVTYFLQRSSSASKFSIDAVTGQLFTNAMPQKFDSEKINTEYLTVVATDGGGQRNSVAVQININDINDEQPKFRRIEYRGVVSENKTDNTDSIVTVEAVDVDVTENNSRVTYSISGGDFADFFQINSSSGEIKLNPSKTLNSEDEVLKSLKGIVTINVTATDSGTPSMSSTVSVKITVQDQNDNDPMFLKEIYVVSISENTTSGFVINVTARDADAEKPNNEIIYRLDRGHEDKFTIDSVAGTISVHEGSKFDYDTKNIFEIIVKAFDRGTPTREGSCTVNISITDINNNEPTFVTNTADVRIKENVDNHTNIYNYTANDLDTDSQLYYEILTDNIKAKTTETTDAYKQWFKIDSNTGSISVNGDLDREMVTEVMLPVFVKDVNAFMPPYQNATAYLTITIEDVYDTPPEIDPVGNISMPETNAIDTLVVRVTATDKDLKDELQFQLGQNPDSIFKLQDSTTGIVRLAKAVDREKNRTLSFVVQVTDKGNLTSSVTVLVEIQDINDNDPQFTSNFESTVNILENATTGTLVTSVTATDEDIDLNGEILYSIEGGYGKFAINNVTGDITVDGKLDRENETDYTLTVIAVDRNVNDPRRTLKALRININDINDVTPHFSENPYTANPILENSALGSTVIVVTATDEDMGVNKEITYSCCEPSNATGLFKIDSQRGQIKVNQSLTQHIGIFYVTVTAADHGIVPRENSTIVNIEITDVNDHAPQFVDLPPAPKFYINENQPVGTLVAEIYATDSDTGINGKVRYKFFENPADAKQDWKKFIINPDSGNLTTKAILDREIQAEYSLEIDAYDLGRPDSKSARVTVKVILRDEDDFLPLFNRKTYPLPYKLQVNEETNSTVIGSVGIAEDKDDVGLSNRSQICYYIAGGNIPTSDINSLFTLDKFTGNLTLDKSVDREATSFFDLYIKASDNCYSRLRRRRDTNINPDAPQALANVNSATFNESDTSLLWVRVEITDINDNPPVFNPKVITAGVSTGEAIESRPIIDFKEYATDKDIGVNSNLTFYITGQTNVSEPLATNLDIKGISKTPFVLDRYRGLITSKEAFSEDLKGNFTFTVRVNDTSGKFDEATVKIYLVTDQSRVKVIIFLPVEAVNRDKRLYEEFFHNLTGVTINIDTIVTHTEESVGKVETQTDMLFHAVGNDGEIWEASVLLDALDAKYSSNIEKFTELKIIKTELALQPVAASSQEQYERVYLPIAAAIIALLFLLLILLIFVMWNYRKSYRRKLRAATAMAFSTEESNGLNHLQMPGTNQHTFEGSNPIFLEAYDNQAMEMDDETSSSNSMGENDGNTTNTYDEIEMSLDLYNDETDHYKQPRLNNSDYLIAALQEHETAKNQKNTELNHANNVTSKYEATGKKMEFTNPAFTQDDKPGTEYFNGMPMSEI